MSLLRTSALTLSLGDRMLVDRAALVLEAGSVTAVTGGAGTGKSLLLRALAGLPLPGVRLDGTVEAAGRRLLVPQGAVLPPHRTLGAVGAELLRHHLGVDAGTAQRRLTQALDRLGVPAAGRRLDLHLHEMSEVQRCRAVYALALAAEPAVLLADAPGAGLDATVRAHLLTRLAEWARDRGAALLLAGAPEDGIAGPADLVLGLEHARLVPVAPPVPPAAAGPEPGAPLLSVRGLGVSFPLGGGRRLPALQSVTFGLAEGEAVALLGETGSGKSLVTRAVLRLVPPTDGRVSWSGRDLATADAAALRRIRREAPLLFPDPAAALDPMLSVGAQLAAALEHLRPELPPDQYARRIADSLEEAGLHADTALLWPAALTAGEAARVGLARALLCQPRALVCDEPAGRLTAGERAAFLDDLLHIRARRRLSLLLAAQNAVDGLHAADRGLVLLMGRVVEEADSATLLGRSRHPYTRILVDAAAGRPPGLPGEAPSPLRPPGGCAFRQRCPNARDYCAQANPQLEEVAPGHRVACHYWDIPRD